MKIRVIGCEHKERWDDYVLSHPQGVAYHQYAWGMAVKKAYGFQPIYLAAEKNKVFVGVLPFIKMKVPFLGNSLVSLPYCDLGGALTDDDVIEKELLAHALSIAQENKSKKLELRQTDISSVISEQKKVRMVLTLPNSAEELIAGFKAKLRSQVKKPIKDGLTFEIGGDELLPEFYKVMALNMRDLGSPVHSFDWFKAVIENYNGKARVCIVRMPDGKPGAAGIILLHKNIVSIPWASSLKKYNRYNPNMLLYWALLSFSANQGYGQFDFGRSTIGEGTFKFKQQWGAESVPLLWRDELSNDPSSITQGKGIVRGVLERLWLKLPVPIATILGSRLRPYISL